MNHPMVDDYDLSSLGSITVGAAPMDENAISQFEKKFPGVILQQGIRIRRSYFILTSFSI